MNSKFLLGRKFDIVDLSQVIEEGQCVYPNLAKTFINVWHTYEETAGCMLKG